MKFTFENIIKKAAINVSIYCSIFFIFFQLFFVPVAYAKEYEACGNYGGFLATLPVLEKYEDELFEDPYNFDIEQRVANQIYTVYNTAGGLSDFCLQLFYESGFLPLMDEDDKWEDDWKDKKMDKVAERLRERELEGYATNYVLRYVEDLQNYFHRAVDELMTSKKFVEEPSYLREMSYKIAEAQEKARLANEGSKQTCSCSYYNSDTRRNDAYLVQVSSKEACQDIGRKYVDPITLEKKVSCEFHSGPDPKNTNLIADQYFEAYKSKLLDVETYDKNIGIAKQYETAIRFILTALQRAEKRGAKIGQFLNGDYQKFMAENEMPYTPQIAKAFGLPQIEMIKKIYAAVMKGNSYDLKQAESWLLLFTARDFDVRSNTEIAANYVQSILTGSAPIPLDLGVNFLSSDIYSSIIENFDGTMAKRVAEKIAVVKDLEIKKHYPLIVGGAAMMLHNILAAKVMAVFMDVVPSILAMDELGLNNTTAAKYGLPAIEILSTIDGLFTATPADLMKGLQGLRLPKSFSLKGYNLATFGTFGGGKLSRSFRQRSRAGSAIISSIRMKEFVKRVASAAYQKSKSLTEYMARRVSSKFHLIKEQGVEFILSSELRALVASIKAVSDKSLKEVFSAGITIVQDFKLSANKKIEVVGGINGSTLRGVHEVSRNDLDISIMSVALVKNADEAAIETAGLIKRFHDKVSEGKVARLKIDPNERAIFGDGRIDLSKATEEEVAGSLKSGGDQYVQLVYAKEIDLIDPTTGRAYLDINGQPIKVSVPVNIHVNVGYRKTPDGKISAISGIEGKDRKHDLFGGQQFNIAYLATRLPGDDKYFKELVLVQQYSMGILGKAPLTENARLNFISAQFKDAQKYYGWGDYFKAAKRALVAGIFSGDEELGMAAVSIVGGNLGKMDVISRSPPPPGSLAFLKQVFFEDKGVLYDPKSVDFVGDSFWGAIKSLEINPKTADWRVISDFFKNWVEEKAKQRAGDLMRVVEDRVNKLSKDAKGN
ncbi:MAG: hypothetical protein HZA94_03200 [Candidatus Vogelbacteria bacterium]|nr:hypothetical protein [Candidatus Vogelbacteria bacterium]